MCSMKNRLSIRLLSVILAIIMVMGTIPTAILTASAVTEGNSNSVTVTVVNASGTAVEGATVKFTVNSKLHGDEYIKDTKQTGDDGVAVIMNSSDFIADDLDIHAEISKSGFATETLTESIDNNAQNFTVTLKSNSESDILSDVKVVAAKGLVYKAKPQSLVSFEGLKDGDEVICEIDGEENTYIYGTDTIDVARTDAGDYAVKVTVSRKGFEDKEVSFDKISIAKANKTGYGIESLGVLKYNKKEQALVKLTGDLKKGIESGEIINAAWYVDEVKQDSLDVPTMVAVNKSGYKVRLAIDFGENYNEYNTAVTTFIYEGEIDIDGLTITGCDLVYTVGKDGKPVAQKAIELSGERKDSYKEDFELLYQIDDGNKKPDNTKWQSEIPTVTNAGSYIVWVKATATNYSDKDVPVIPAKGLVEPYNVRVDKATQNIQFNNYETEASITVEGEPLPFERSFDFSAYKVSGCEDGTISYSVSLSDEMEEYNIQDCATIDAEGKLIVKRYGVFEVKATLSGNANYKEQTVTCTFYVTYIVPSNDKNPQEGTFFEFSQDKVDYVFGTNDGTVSTQTYKQKEWGRREIHYYINQVKDTSYKGLSINDKGKVTVSDYNELAKAIRTAGGKLSVTVFAYKKEHRILGILTDTAEDIRYTLNITFAETPEEPYTIDDTNMGNNSWYKDSVQVNPVDGYSVALNTPDIKNFKANDSFADQGTQKRYIYLREQITGGITDRIPVNVKIDSIAPVNLRAEYSKSLLDQIIETVTLGFYNPSVTVRFFADDVTSGIEKFVWSYTRESSASDINTTVIKDIEIAGEDISFEGDTYFAQATLTAEEYGQMRGNISFIAYDKAGNIAEKVDEENTFVVDTISSVMSVTYDSCSMEKDNIRYYGYNKNYTAQLTFNIKEANFDKYFAEVSVNGVTVDNNGSSVSIGNGSASLVWTSSDADNHRGVLTITGEGTYEAGFSYNDPTGNSITYEKDGIEYEVEYDTDSVQWTSQQIIIDAVNPLIEQPVYDEKNQSITITVIEDHFDAAFMTADVSATYITNKHIVNEDELKKIINDFITDNDNWVAEGNGKYTLVLGSGETGILWDANYSVTFGYKDLAGNNANPVSCNFVIDHVAPANVDIEYSTPLKYRIIEVLSFGIYDAPITVKFTADDSVSGVKVFDWMYRREEKASKSNTEKIVSTLLAIEEKIIDFIHLDWFSKKFKAEYKISSEEYDQLRGTISVTACDNMGNSTETMNDSEKPLILDIVAPTRTVLYSEADRVVDADTLDTVNAYKYDSEGNNVKMFYHDKATVSLQIKEANFIPEDVHVYDNGETNEIPITNWSRVKDEKGREKDDNYIASFDITSEGEHIITMKYTDVAGNDMPEYQSPRIVIDKTVPEVKVTFSPKELTVPGRDYLNNKTTATIKIKEHNFRADDVAASVAAKDVSGNDIKVNDYYAYLSNRSNWISNGDEHTATVTFDKEANYTFYVNYEDLAKNKAADFKGYAFTVDKTSPKFVGTKYSTHVLETILSNITFGFYKSKVTVTVSAEDTVSGVNKFDYSYVKAKGVSAVNAQLLDQAVSEASIKYSNSKKTATMSFSIPKSALRNNNQFNGTVKFDAIDRSGNRVNKAETKRLVVDNIAPTVKVSFNSPVNSENGISYYNGNINGTISVNEANFYSGDVEVMATKNGSAPQRIATSWRSSDTDHHTGTFTLTEDADYVVTVYYKDKSGNALTPYKSNQLTIDTKIAQPVFTIQGQSKSGDNGGSYKGDVIKVAYRFEDQNYNSNTVKLTQTKYNKIEDVTSKFVKTSVGVRGGSGLISILKEEDNDGIYVLTVSMTDKANHQTQAHVKFTVNNYGSVFECGEYLYELDNKKYVKKVEEDIVITEYNANKQSDVKIELTKDITPIFLQKDKDYTVDVTNENGWAKYVYKIKSDNFKENNHYKLDLLSRDTNGNLKSLDKKVFFTVDNESPEIIFGKSFNKQIAESEKIDKQKFEMTFDVRENNLSNVEVYVDDELIKWDQIGNTYSFTVAEKSEPQKIRIKVTDKAGNETDTQDKAFLEKINKDNPEQAKTIDTGIIVSTNAMIRWYYNKPLFFGTIGGVVVIIAAVWLVIAKAKKRNQNQ